MTSPKRLDSFYFQAKKLRYRSRAAFKLLELQEKFRIINEGAVLELGSSPGGWTQVIRELTEAPVLAMDMTNMRPVEGVDFIRSDMAMPEAEEKIGEWLRSRGIPGFGSVLSDAMVKTSGNRLLDHSRSVDLCEAVLKIAGIFLLPGGNVVTKMFQGEMTAGFVSKYSRLFRSSKATSVSATREGSREIYIIFRGFIGHC
ncbi:MAG: RlmE family RNA methyltransferase [Candidatus Thermoplasmatota archaeon]|nr:RlmE family RNA methyltransferase [Candidatus Thermoplasmatota archaeon]MCL5731187.1 RlmE family RNA methyltransferase [Candidatus Thermoplasmatota archaeon]